MRIGLISDTHGHMEDQILEEFKGCDEIWHAGDIGRQEVLDQLNAIAPVKAVYGNIDGHELRADLPEYLLIKKNGLKTLLIHIAGSPPAIDALPRKLIKEHQPQLLICGHSHILKVFHLGPEKDLLYINPGAAGHHGLHKIRTLLRFTIYNGQPKDMEVVELGLRGKEQPGDSGTRV